jgi:hypothetical protein
LSDRASVVVGRIWIQLLLAVTAVNVTVTASIDNLAIDRFLEMIHAAVRGGFVKEASFVGSRERVPCLWIV